jgi:hypothetical protein
MNKLSRAARAQALQWLCKGTNIKATNRRTGVSMTALLRLVGDSGRAASWYQDRVFRNLNSKKIEINALWGFKDPNVPGAKKGWVNPGNVWVWFATDPQTKLILSWFLAGQDAASAVVIINDVAARFSGRVQLRSYGQRLALETVKAPLEANIDYAILAKLYAESSKAQEPYGSALGIGGQKRRIVGNPGAKPIRPAWADGSNVGFEMRRPSSLPKASTFEKRLANHANALALHFLHYNFVRIHKGLRSTPAMAAGITSRRWKFNDIVDVLEAWEAAG